MTETYNVYELRTHGTSYIGSVDAEDREAAVDAAHRKFGAPISVVSDS